MKAILYNDDDDRFCVIFPNYSECNNDEEKENLLQLVINKDLPKKIDGSNRQYFIKDYKDIEERKYLKSAWKLNNLTGDIYFDNDIAKEIKKNQFRILREPLFRKLDVEFIKALEQGNSDELNKISLQKNILRDITKIDLSELDTPQKLHSFIPDVLKQ